MRLTVAFSGFVAAFVAGLLTAYVAARTAGARPPPSPLTPGIIDIRVMTDEEIGPLINNTDLRSRLLVSTEHGTVAIQSGNVVKHYHADANEVQVILEGAGSFWLDDKEVQVRAGDLIIIPKGVVHAGSKASTGRFRALVVKLPPQRQDDTHRVP